MCVHARQCGLINNQQMPGGRDAREGLRGIWGHRGRTKGLHFVDRWTSSNKSLIVQALIRQAGVLLGTHLTPAAQHTL